MKLLSYISSAFLAVCLLVITPSFAQTAAGTDSLKTVIVTVNGITCSGDLKMITTRLVKQAGIDECVLSSSEKGKATFQVGYHTSLVSEAQLRKYVEGTPSCDFPDQYPYKVKKLAYVPVTGSGDVAKPKQ